MEFTVADEGRPRLDQFLSAELPDFSRSRLQKLIRNGACLIDGAPALDPDARLLPGQIINLFPPPTSTTLIPEKGEVRVVWQSPHAIVCDKPAGLTVHP